MQAAINNRLFKLHIGTNSTPNYNNVFTQKKICYIVVNNIFTQFKEIELF